MIKGPTLTSINQSFDLWYKVHNVFVNEDLLGVASSSLPLSDSAWALGRRTPGVGGRETKTYLL
jgi:hypothetical protein